MMKTNISDGIVIFDGICNICNASVRFILKYERETYFKFASSQSPQAKVLLEKFEILRDSNSVFLIENGILYKESTAALKIAKHLKYFNILYFFILVPERIRNGIYQLISRNRYKWFGKRESCMIVDDNNRNRFL